jgi:ABC-type transporter Mla subunit MlaD
LVLGAAGLLFAAAAGIPRLPWTPTTRYQIHLPLGYGVGTLAEGAPVVAAGLRKGEVRSVAPGRSRSDLRSDDIMVVTLDLLATFPVSDQVRARLLRPLIGTVTSVELLGVDLPGTPRAPGSVIPWERPPSTIEVLVGPDKGAAVLATLDQVASLPVTYRPIIASLRETLGRLEETGGALSAQIEGEWSRWRSDLEELRSMPDSVEPPVEELRAAAAAVRQSLASLHETFEAAQNRIATIIPVAGGNLRELEALNLLDAPDGQSIAEAHAIIDRLAALAGRVEEDLDRLAGLPESLRLDLDVSLANASLIGELFARMVDELPREALEAIFFPLARDRRAAIDDVLRDESVRLLARAIEELRAAREAVEGMGSDGDGPTLAAPAGLLDRIERAEIRAREAARRLFEERVGLVR